MEQKEDSNAEENQIAPVAASNGLDGIREQRERLAECLRLIECLRLLYFRCGRFRYVSYIGCRLYRSKKALLNLLNEVLRFYEIMPPRSEAIQQVQRTLSWQPKMTTRKGKAPRRIEIRQTQVFYYKPIRKFIIRKVIGRGYLNAALLEVQRSIDSEAASSDSDENGTDSSEDETTDDSENGDE